MRRICYNTMKKIFIYIKCVKVGLFYSKVKTNLNFKALKKFLNDFYFTHHPQYLVHIHAKTMCSHALEK